MGYLENIDRGYQEQANLAAYWAGKDAQKQHEAHKVMQDLVNLRNQHIANQQPSGGGGGGGGQTAEQVQAAIDAALAQQRRDDKARKDQEAKAILTSRFKEFGGMEGLINDLDRLIREWGNNTDVIMAKIPETETYKTRFKGLVDLRKKGVTDIRNESEYLGLEREYRSVFREAGMRDFLGPDGTQTQFDAIAELVSDYSVSVNEVRSRVNDAARVVADTSQETIDALQEYYGLDMATLTEYVLDPVRTQDKINQISNATLLGGGAARAGLDVGLSTAEKLADVGGNQDMNAGVYQQQFTKAATLRDATERLAGIEDTTLTDSEVLESSMDLDADAKKKVKGLQSRERARFGGSSGITSSSLATNN
jgi:hypothetical protein